MMLLYGLKEISLNEIPNTQPVTGKFIRYYELTLFGKEI